MWTTVWSGDTGVYGILYTHKSLSLRTKCVFYVETRMFYVLKIEVCDAESLRWQAGESKKEMTDWSLCYVRSLRICVCPVLFSSLLCAGYFCLLGTAVFGIVLLVCYGIFWRRIMAFLGVLR